MTETNPAPPAEGARALAEARAARILDGDVRATARLLRDVDDRRDDYVAALKLLFPHTGRAFVLGVTGNPGAGKSTLVDALITALRAMPAGARGLRDDRADGERLRVGVIAIDPSSPFSGGAVLGDRIRMQRHALDPGVFIRSIATRGHLGGLSRSAADAVRVLDAFGCAVVIVETVGVGQDELEVARLAHTTIVVVAPGMGDEVQAIKAGILEIADVFAVNKADRQGADGTVRDLQGMIALGDESQAAVAASRLAHGHHASHALPAAEMEGAADPSRWSPPVLKTVATRGEGVGELLDAAMRHREHLVATPAGQRRLRERLREQLEAIFRDALADRALETLGDAVDDAVRAVASRATDPYTASEQLVTAVLRSETT